MRKFLHNDIVFIDVLVRNNLNFHGNFKLVLIFFTRVGLDVWTWCNRPRIGFVNEVLRGGFDFHVIGLVGRYSANIDLSNKLGVSWNRSGAREKGHVGRQRVFFRIIGFLSLGGLAQIRIRFGDLGFLLCLFTVVLDLLWRRSARFDCLFPRKSDPDLNRSSASFFKRMENDLSLRVGKGALYAQPGESITSDSRSFS